MVTGLSFTFDKCMLTYKSFSILYHPSEVTDMSVEDTAGHLILAAMVLCMFGVVLDLILVLEAEIAREGSVLPPPAPGGMQRAGRSNLGSSRPEWPTLPPMYGDGPDNRQRMPLPAVSVRGHCGRDWKNCILNIESLSLEKYL